MQLTNVNIDFSFPGITGSTTLPFPYTIWDLIPPSYSCPVEIERIGRMGDGGKWICGLSQYEKSDKPCIVYSFGRLPDF